MVVEGIFVAQERKFFRLTSEGRSLWARRNNLPLPLEYRRILGLVDYAGHPEVIRSYLARYPGQVVDEWLNEFEALRLIESISATEVSLSEISRKTEPPPLEAEDIGHSELEVSFADISLTRLGVYVAYDRIAHRPASSKRPADTLALIVEDDPDQLALAVLRLTSAGYPVETAASVQALFSALQKRTPDAIFLDIGLPDGDGFEVLATLRQHPSCAPLPIILLTAKTEAEAPVVKDRGALVVRPAMTHLIAHAFDERQIDAPLSCAIFPDSANATHKKPV